jgi:predicted RNA binding protein YcfA (HicA-like mRNA interferase family)
VTKLPVVSGKDMIKYLSDKGFTVRPAKGSHYFLTKKNDDGTLTTTTIPLHKELDTGTLLGILKDVGIEREQFIQEW